MNDQWHCGDHCSGCKTVSGRNCIFEFEGPNGRLHSGCITHDNNGTLWCKSVGNTEDERKGNCMPDCPGNP